MVRLIAFTTIPRRAEACFLCIVPYLLAILAFNSLIVSGLDFNCSYIFRTINTFEDIEAVNISCYSNLGAPCGVFYAAPGKGCTNESAFIDTVNGGIRKTLSHNFVFGGAFCTNFQIDASYMVEDRIMQMPRAYDAGLQFNKGFFDLDAQINRGLLVAVSALASSATLEVTSNLPEKFSKSLDPFETITFELLIDFDKTVSYQFNSDNPIVVSYSNSTANVKYYYIWRPISYEPVMLFVPVGHKVEIRAQYCSNNSNIPLLPSTDSVTVDSLTTSEDGSGCKQNELVYTDHGYTLEYTTDCFVVSTPMNEVCTSVSLFDTKANNFTALDMGAPMSRLSNQYVGNFTLNLKVSSYDKMSCVVNSVGGHTSSTTFEQYANSESDRPPFYYSNIGSPETILQVSCNASSFISSQSDDNPQNLGHSGRMQESLWEPYFDSFICENPTPTPTPSHAIASISGKAWLIALCYGLLFLR